MPIVEIDWDKFLRAQQQLDFFIFEKFDLNYFTTSKKRLFALIVELSELLNETKLFKFWSRSSADRKKVLEEYIDVFHFLLSGLLEKKVKKIHAFYKVGIKLEENELLDLFKWLIMNYEDFYKLAWIQKFLDLGSYLGFKWKDIEKAYWMKRDLNIDRQNTGY